MESTKVIQGALDNLEATILSRRDRRLVEELYQARKATDRILLKAIHCRHGDYYDG